MSVPELLNSINGVADLHAELKDDERCNLLAACARLHSKLENPFEMAIRFMFAVSG
jgi:hypothetical protein